MTVTSSSSKCHLKSLLETAPVGDQVGNGAASKENGEDGDGGE